MNLSLFCLVALTLSAAAGDLPAFASDAAADRWLREQSTFYRQMAEVVESRQGYSIRGKASLEGGLVSWEKGSLVIELGDALAGPKRVSILIFELTNCYQSPRHVEIDQAAQQGRIANEREFGLLHELVEYDGLRHHRHVLRELEPVLGGIPLEMFAWAASGPKTFAEYELPLAYDYVKAQSASGHTAHYHRWFAIQAGVAAAAK